MNAYNEAFIKYVREHPLKYYDVEMDSVIDLFFQCYTEGNPRDNEFTRKCFRQIEELSKPLTLEEKNALFITICDLYMEHERNAFLEGVRIGGRWGMEIRGK